MQTRTVLFAGEGRHGRRVPMEDRGGKQCRERTGRLDDMPACDPPLMSEVSDRRKLQGRLGMHSSRNPLTATPFPLWGEVPDNNWGMNPNDAVWDVVPPRSDAIENADWLVREENMLNMPATYIETARRLQSEIGDWTNQNDDWFGGYPQITVAPVNPQIDLPIPVPHESDNYAAEVNHEAGAGWERSTGTEQRAGIDWDSSFAQSRGNRGAPDTTGSVNQEDALTSVAIGAGVAQRRDFIFGNPTNYVNQETALTSQRIAVDETSFLRPRSWTRRKSMFVQRAQEDALTSSRPYQDSALQLRENHPFFNMFGGRDSGVDNHNIDTAWDRFSRNRVIREYGRPVVEVPEVRQTAGPPMLHQVATIDRRGLNPRGLVMERDEYGSVHDVGLMRAQTVENPGTLMNESTFQMNVQARRGLFRQQ